jgi:hypothetical protein
MRPNTISKISEMDGPFCYVMSVKFGYFGNGVRAHYTYEYKNDFKRNIYFIYLYIYINIYVTARAMDAFDYTFQTNDAEIFL